MAPARRGRGGDYARVAEPQAQQRTAMTPSQRLERMSGIDIETRPARGGAARSIARIEDPQVIGQLLIRMDLNVGRLDATRRPRLADAWRAALVSGGAGLQ